MGGSIRIAYVAGLVLAIVSPIFLRAQEHPLAPEHPGSWKATPPIKPGLMPATLTAAERSAATSLTGQMFDLLHTMPEMAPSAGFEVFPYVRVALDSLDETAGNTSVGNAVPKYVSVDVTLNVAPYEHIDGGVDGNERDTAGSIEIKTNNLQPLLGSGMTELGKTWVDQDGQFIESPPDPAGMLHGHPVYEEGNGSKWVLMARSDVPFFAPVTRERYLALFTKYVQERLNEIQNNRAKLPAGLPANITQQMDEAITHFQQVLNDLKSQQASMSAEERSAPAILTKHVGDETPEFTTDSSSGIAIQSFNPALMDKAQPRTAVQIIAVHFSSDEDHWPGMVEKIENDLDWAGLEKLLH